MLLAVAACGDDGLGEGVSLPTRDRTELAAVALLDARCSAAAIDVGGDDDDPAYVLTAGHCAGWRAIRLPYVVNIEEPTLGNLSFGVFTDAEDAPIVVPAVRAEYTSMLGADLAIYQLDTTNAGLRARGVTPLRLAEEAPPVGAPITVAGFPQETEEDPRRVLHESACVQGETVRLAEGSIVFVDFMANDCNGVRDGSSGGPALDEDGRIFGVLSTSGEPDGLACALDHPCEVQGEPLQFHEGRVYTAPLRGLAACFVDGRFDLEGAGCGLTRPDLPRVDSDTLFQDLNTLRWQVTLRDEGLPFYRYKAGLSMAVRCEDDAGYGPMLAIADAPTIMDPLPDAPGQPAVLCIQGHVTATPVPPERFLDRTIALQVIVGET